MCFNTQVPGSTKAPVFYDKFMLTYCEHDYKLVKNGKTAKIIMEKTGIDTDMPYEDSQQNLTENGCDKGKHNLVEFIIEGVSYTADATNSFLDKVTNEIFCQVFKMEIITMTFS